MACPASKPRNDAPFGVFLDYYTQRAELTQNRLSVGARINQSRLNKIANDRIRDVSVDTLVNLCLVLHLDREEAKDLLSRKERAFSPANPVHRAYLELIDEYSSREIDYTNDMMLSTALGWADEYLASQGCPALPNADRG